MPGVEIRDAGEGDLEGICALEARAFVSDRLASNSLQRFLKRRSARLRVARRNDGAILGYHLILFRKGSKVARLYSIAVDDRRRGKGLGRRLLADAETIAASAKQRVLRLEVREENQPAIRLYEHRGYRPIGRHRHYYADKADALRYEKTLGEGASADEEDRGPRRAVRPKRNVRGSVPRKRSA